MRQVPVDLSLPDRSRSEELAQALTPMIAKIEQCELSPKGEALAAEAHVLLKYCPSAVFLLEAMLVSEQSQPIMGSSGPLAVTREIWTGDDEDRASYCVKVPWTMIEEARKTDANVHAKFTLTDSLGKLRSVSELHKVPARPAK